MSEILIKEINFEKIPWDKLELLIAKCYPKPPRNVFDLIKKSS